MKIKYYRYTLQGEHSAEDAQRALGDAASQSIIVRVDNVGGQTHVYVASQAAPAVKVAAGGKKAGDGGVKAEEVSESEVLKIR